MLPSNHMTNSLSFVQKRFSYRQDNGSDKWKIHKTLGEFHGDYEDFALTLLWHLSDQSMLRFWWNLMFRRAVIWHVASHDGQEYTVLYWRGMYADNMEKSWYGKTNMRCERHFSWLPIMIAIRFLLARTT